MQNISVSCNCGQDFQVRGEVAAGSVVCPSCKEKILITDMGATSLPVPVTGNNTGLSITVDAADHPATIPPRRRGVLVPFAAGMLVCLAVGALAYFAHFKALNPLAGSLPRVVEPPKARAIPLVSEPSQRRPEFPAVKTADNVSKGTNSESPPTNESKDLNTLPELLPTAMGGRPILPHRVGFIRRLSGKHAGPVTSVSFSGDESRAYSTDSKHEKIEPVANFPLPPTRVYHGIEWNLGTGRPRPLPEAGVYRTGAEWNRGWLCTSNVMGGMPGSSRVAYMVEHSLVLFDPASHAEVNSYTGLPSLLGKQRKLRIFASASRTEIIDQPVPPSDHYQAICWIPQGRGAVAVQKTGGLVLFDLVSSRGRDFLGPAYSSAALDFSEDGRRVVVGNALGVITLYDISSLSKPSAIDTYEGHKVHEVKVYDGNLWIPPYLRKHNEVTRLRLDTTAGKIYSMGTAGVHVIDLTDFRKVAGGNIPIGLPGPYELSPDWRYAVAGDASGKLRVWSVEEGKEIPLEGPGHEGPITCVGLSPDGFFALSGAADGSVVLWGLPRPTQASMPNEETSGGVMPAPTVAASRSEPDATEDLTNIPRAGNPSGMKPSPVESDGTDELAGLPRAKRAEPSKAAPGDGNDDMAGVSRAAARPSEKSKAPRKVAAPPKPASPYAHITNAEARAALENAAKNTSHLDSAAIAERFLKQAEKVAKGDAAVLEEVKKLRDVIAALKRNGH